MQSFFDPVIRKVVRCIRDHQAPDTTKIVVPGGFGRNQYLMDELRTHFASQSITIHGQMEESVGSYHPVSRGTLLRFDEIKRRGLKPNESFGIATIELYDEDIHDDASHENGKVIHDDVYDEWNVFERWTPLLKPVSLVAQKNLGTICYLTQ